MFAIECASKLRKCGCSSFDVETITMNSGYRGCYRANHMAVWYARQAIPKRSRIYITHQKCNTCMTSKVRGIFRPTKQSMITKEHSHRNKSSKHRTRIKTNWPNRGGGWEVEVKETITNLHGIRRKWNGPNVSNYPACFAVGLPQVKIGVEGYENTLIK